MNSESNDHRKFRILSIDGGGIRGIIPALVLDEIEKRTGQPINELFDLIAGTSTGAILAYGLTCPDAGGKAKYSANDLAGFYEREGQNIFPTKFFPTMSMLLDFLDEKYDAKGLESVLESYFGDTTILRALTPTLVTAYEIESQTTVFFSSREAGERCPDYLMRDVLRGATAAPTYFEPLKLPVPGVFNRQHASAVFRDREYLALIDGGIFANNPAMCAYVEAEKLARDAEAGYDGYTLVSIGCGERTQSLAYSKARNWGLAEWALPVLRTIFDGIGDTVDYQLASLLNKDDEQDYYRLQVDFNAVDPDGAHAVELDDASPETIAKLKGVAGQLIAGESAVIDRICADLTKGRT